MHGQQNVRKSNRLFEDLRIISNYYTMTTTSIKNLHNIKQDVQDGAKIT